MSSWQEAAINEQAKRVLLEDKIDKIRQAVKNADDESYGRWSTDPEQIDILNNLIVEINNLIGEPT